MDVMGDYSPSEANAEDNGVDLQPLHDQEEQTNHVEVALIMVDRDRSHLRSCRRPSHCKETAGMQLKLSKMNFATAIVKAITWLLPGPHDERPSGDRDNLPH